MQETRQSTLTHQHINLCSGPSYKAFTYTESHRCYSLTLFDLVLVHPSPEDTSAQITMREFTLEEVGVHQSKSDLWVAIHGKGDNNTALPLELC